VPTITVTVNDNNGHISTWTYVNSDGSATASNFTVTKTDPAGNQTVYWFSGGYQTQSAAYEGGCPTSLATGCNGSNGTLFRTITTCYNANFTSCATPSPVVTLPLSQADVYTSYNGSSSQNLVEIKFDTTYGNITEVKQYDFGATTPPRGNPLSDTTITHAGLNGVSCGTVAPYQYDRACSITTLKLSGSTMSQVSQVNYTYANGHPTQTSTWVNGSNYLTSSATYNTNGTVNNATSVIGGISSFGYNGTDGCNGVLPTSVTLSGTGLPSGGLATSTQWDCRGGVAIETADANGQQTLYTYTDPFWRITSMMDPLGNMTSYSYPSPTTTEISTNYGTVSTSDMLMTSDGLARQIFSQTRQGQGSSTFDTVQTTYGWTTTTSSTRGGPFTTTSMPYPGTQAQTAPNGTGLNTTQNDVTNRPISVSNTGGALLSNTYSLNDVLSVLSPAPSGENNKQVQNQYDGLGRLTSSCAISPTVSGNVACGQNTGISNGILTTTAYTAGTGYQTVTSSRGPSNQQQRSVTVDGAGRTTQKQTPEGGVWTYTYDSNSSCPSGYGGTGGVSASGQLASVKDPNLNLLCYKYDAANRVTGVNASVTGVNNGTTCRHFYYDNSLGYSGSLPTGVTTPAYPNGRMVEAATDSCSSGTLITDEWFSYDKDGRAATQWEFTPHSGTYYEAVASYTGPALTTVQLLNPSLYTMTYGLDGEGRWSTLTDTTANQDIVTKTTFNSAGQPLNVQLTGTTPDQDVYTYDLNTGNMKSFQFEVGNTPVNLVGTLNWNTNGSLGQLGVIDGFNAGGTETCNSNSMGELGSGYDDLGRLTEFDCGSGNWGQQFAYDQYDNLTKTVLSGRTGTTWSPGYSQTTNHYSSPSNCCDSNGNVKADGNEVYGWNEFSKLAWTAASGTPTCGTSGRCATYDAFGRMVEASNNSTWHEYWYTQAGKMVMAGTTLSYGRWPTSSGTAETVGTTNFDYLHADWLGNSRIVSNIGNNSVAADQAYTPYGEIYNIFGANNGQYQVFASTIADLAGSTTTPIMWDTPNRELSYAGRWLSPDPAGAGWNQYAYATNPNSQIDPLGLDDCLQGGDCGGGGGGGCDDCGGGRGWGWGGWGGDGCGDPANCSGLGGFDDPPLGVGGPATSAGQGIFSGQDCLYCYPLGPSVLQIVQAALSGNLWGALGGGPLTSCLPICDFTTVPGYQPPVATVPLPESTADWAWWNLPGPPRLCRWNQCGAATISGPQLPTVSATPQAPVQPNSGGYGDYLLCVGEGFLQGLGNADNVLATIVVNGAPVVFVTTGQPIRALVGLGAAAVFDLLKAAALNQQCTSAVYGGG
jgi:hypothetical protein